MLPSGRARKVALGQFYTSRPIADFMVRLADEPTSCTQALEPGIGAGVFLDALLDAGFPKPHGIDLDDGNVSRAADRLAGKVKLTHSDFLAVPAEEAYDLVIGNPPYVAWQNLDQDTRTRLLETEFWRGVANGQWDLLYAFIIWAAEHLKPGGQLIYIVPFNWFNSTYAATLRRYLAEHGAFEDLVHFGEFKLFSDCYPNCLIFSWRKGGDRRQPVFCVEYDGHSGPVEPVIKELHDHYDTRTVSRTVDRTEKLWSIFTQPQPAADELWYLASPARRRRVQAVEDACGNASLADACSVAVGMVSGRDSAYVVSDDLASRLTSEEEKLVKPFVKARTCERYRLGTAQPMIFADSVSDEDELRRRLPNLHAHLVAHRAALESRYLAGNKRWWHWATVRNLDLVANATRSIIWLPGIDRAPRARFCRSPAGMRAAGDVLAIVPHDSTAEDDRYLLAWLNSSAVNDWYRIKGSRTGRRIRYTQAYVQQIPLRRLDFADPRESGIHDQICALVDRIEAGDLDVDRGQAQIDELFDDLG